MRLAFGTAMLLLMAAPASAFVKNWPDAGDFTIAEGEQYCALTTEYQGPGETRLTVALHRDKTAYIMVENMNWSAKQDEPYRDIEFHLNNKTYGGGLAAGIENGTYKGFIVRSNGSIMDSLATSPYLHVYKGAKIIDRLNLDGSSAAVAEVRRCVAYVDGLRKAEENERKKYEDLPKDPFGN